MNLFDLLVLNAAALILFVGSFLLSERIQDIIDTWFSL